MSERKILSNEQQKIVDELVRVHGLEPDQISFEGNETTPILDYEAVCALSLKLTDIQSIECEISERDFEQEIITARCTVTLPDGRMRTSEDSARVGDLFGNRQTIDSMRLAEGVAQNRAVRRGIRSVGVNLYNAHKKFMETGEIASGHTNSDPRYPDYQEIKTIVGKLGWSDETYRQFIADNFDGKTSQTELDDLELQRFKTMLRALKRTVDSGNRNYEQPKAA